MLLQSRDKQAVRRCLPRERGKGERRGAGEEEEVERNSMGEASGDGWGMRRGRGGLHDDGAHCRRRVLEKRQRGGHGMQAGREKEGRATTSPAAFFFFLKQRDSEKKKIIIKNVSVEATPMIFFS